MISEALLRTLRILWVASGAPRSAEDIAQVTRTSLRAAQIQLQNLVSNGWADYAPRPVPGGPPIYRLTPLGQREANTTFCPDAPDAPQPRLQPPVLAQHGAHRATDHDRGWA